MIDKLHDYKNPVQTVFKRLCTTYGQQFIRKDAAPHLMEWIKAISEAQLPIENLEAYTLYITEQSYEFKKYPPKISQFIAGYKEWSSLTLNTGSDSRQASFEELFQDFYLQMDLRYEGLWGRSESVSIDAHREFWKREIQNENINPKTLKKLAKKVRETARFKVYPPNIDQFIELAKIIEFDADLPLIEDSYDQAIAAKTSKNLHPLIRYVRSKFGYATLIDRRNITIKVRFEDEYREAIKDFMNGRLDLSSINTSEGEPGDCPSVCDKVELISSLDNILRKMGVQE